MKNLRTRWLLVFVLFLGMSATACGMFEEEPTPSPVVDDDDDGDSDTNAEEDVEETVDEVEEVETEAEAEPVVEEVVADDTVEEDTAVSEETESSESDGLLGGLFAESVNVSETVQEFDTLSSYQMEMEFSTTYSETTQVVQATIVISTDPPQSQMTFAFTGFSEMAGMESMSMTQIEGTSYMEVPGFGCITTSDADMMGENFADSMDASEFLEDIGEAELVGEETINGIDTLHYTFDETAVQDDMAELNWAQGDVYIAKEGNYVVRFRLEGEGNVADSIMTFEGSDTTPNSIIGQVVVTMDITNVNEPVNITVPEECENSGADNAEYPILEDAAEFSSFGNFITYTTETAFAEIVAFYQESLAAEGWIYNESDSLILENSTALMYFSMDDRDLTVTVTEVTGTSSFTVLVLEE